MSAERCASFRPQYWLTVKFPSKLATVSARLAGAASAASPASNAGRQGRNPPRRELPIVNPQTRNCASPTPAPGIVHRQPGPRNCASRILALGIVHRQPGPRNCASPILAPGTLNHQSSRGEPCIVNPRADGHGHAHAQCRHGRGCANAAMRRSSGAVPSGRTSTARRKAPTPA